MAVVKDIPKYKGWYVVPKFANLNVRKKPSVNADIMYNIKKGSYAGKHKGKQIVIANAQDWIPIESRAGYLAFVRIDVIKVSETKPKVPTKEEQKELLQKLIATDIVIFRRLASIGVLISQLERKGYKVENQKALYKQLVKNYSDRQDIIKKSGAIKFQELKSDFTIWWLKNKYFLGITGVGALPAVPIAIGVILGVSLSVALYYILRPTYDQATRDLKITGTFKKWLEQLPDDAQKEISDDLEKQIDKAFNIGLFRGKFGSLWTIGKYAIIGIVSIWGFGKLLDYADKQRDKKSK